MGATDIYLFGIVLVIFAYNIAFGFVFDLSKAERQVLPAWMRPSGMHELKTTLVGVILVYLVVDFATDWAESNSSKPGPCSSSRSRSCSSPARSASSPCPSRATTA